MARLPDGEPAPADGALPVSALAELGTRPFGVYVHVPFCASRCGYCDFNTYTAGELRGFAHAGFAAVAIAEVRLARRRLGDDIPPVETVFFGGGTPTLLPPADLAAILAAIDASFGLAPDAEITTESNPESVDAAALAALRAAGFTRISFGMQSAREHVLAVLDRRHTPGRPAAAVAEARAAGFTHVSLDLIYGAPGESDEDWRASLDAALATEPDHVSAYALVVEPGTSMHARVRRGELPPPDDDDLASRYEAADAALSAAGLDWYEISNWAAGPDARSRHNLGYWCGHDWWGIGPGAHSHVGGVRWWNVLHPATYAQRLAAGGSPAAGREVLDAATRRAERAMLEVRLAEGVSLDVVGDGPVAAELVREGLADSDALAAGRVALTLRGRLLADGVARRLLE